MIMKNKNTQSIEELEELLRKKTEEAEESSKKLTYASVLSDFMPQVEHIRMSSRQIWLPTSSDDKTDCPCCFQD